LTAKIIEILPPGIQSLNRILLSPKSDIVNRPTPSPAFANDIESVTLVGHPCGHHFFSSIASVRSGNGEGRCLAWYTRCLSEWDAYLHLAEVCGRDHLRLLEQREESLSEGIDLLPEIRVKHLEIQNLTPEIAQLEQRIQWLVGECVARLNAQASQISGREYIKSRDNLRRAAERFRVDLAAVIREIEASANLGPSLTDPHNSKLAEIEKLLGDVHFPRVMYRLLPLPPLDAELVRRNQILDAIDHWIAGLW